MSFPSNSASYPTYPPFYTSSYLTSAQAQPYYATHLDYYRRYLTATHGAQQYSFNPAAGPTAGAPLGYPWPAPMDPATMAYQAAQAAANNASLAAMPQAPNYYVGGNPTDYYAQQAWLVAQGNFAQPPPNQLAPFKPIDGTAFWVKNVDTTYEMRSHADILAGECSPGHWERSPTSGYYWWVRDA